MINPEIFWKFVFSYVVIKSVADKALDEAEDKFESAKNLWEEFRETLKVIWED